MGDYAGHPFRGNQYDDRGGVTVMRGDYKQLREGSTFESDTRRVDMLAPVSARKMLKPDSFAGGFLHLYHVTSLESAEKISNEGFDNAHLNQFQGFESAHSGMYGWNNLERARYEVQRAEENAPGAAKEMAVVHFQIPQSAWGHLRPDEDSGVSDWKVSYRGGSAAFTGNLPRAWIVGNYVDRSARLKGAR